MIDMSNGSDAASIGAALIGAFGAIISAIVAAIISVISLVITNKNNTKVEELRNKLAIEKDEEGACRDYEYEARKRLYQEFEPLLFLLLEYSESSLIRIYGLVESARNGKLNPNSESGWLETYGHGYYATSTIYRLLLPMVIFKIMQQKLTMFDLDLEPIPKIDKHIA
jgi:hypothetical protein